MRQRIVEEFYLKENKHPFVFENEHGHVFQVMIISGDVIRVRFLTEKEKDSLVDLPASQDAFAENYTASIKKDGQDSSSIEIETTKIRLVVILRPTFHLSWYSASNGNTVKEQMFTQDLPYRAYGYDQTASDVWHYQRKHPDVLYYGLGERTGPLDLAGRRFRLERLDCMGYDAEKSDPLYKFCPFYIGLSNQYKEAYGIYYNNFSNTTIDLGQEVDAVGYYAAVCLYVILIQYTIIRCGDLIPTINVTLDLLIIT
jgi:alpha-glucosidase